MSLLAPAARAQAPAQKAAAGKDQYAVFETSRGKIGVELLPAEAPKTVQNFVELATARKPFKDPLSGESRKAAYFDGTLFHRVIPGFMIEGGYLATRGAALGANPRRISPLASLAPATTSRTSSRCRDQAFREALRAGHGEPRDGYERLAVLHHRGERTSRSSSPGPAARGRACAGTRGSASGCAAASGSARLPGPETPRRAS